MSAKAKVTKEMIVDAAFDIARESGADMKAFEHVNYCLAVRKSEIL